MKNWFVPSFYLYLSETLSLSASCLIVSVYIAMIVLWRKRNREAEREWCIRRDDYVCVCDLRFSLLLFFSSFLFSLAFLYSFPFSSFLYFSFSFVFLSFLFLKKEESCVCVSIYVEESVFILFQENVLCVETHHMAVFSLSPSLRF